jgi:apolipoprotein N-acyltransferase
MADSIGMTGMLAAVVFVFVFFALMIGGFDPKVDGNNAMITLACIGGFIGVCKLIYWWLHFLFGAKIEKTNDFEND